MLNLTPIPYIKDVGWRGESKTPKETPPREIGIAILSLIFAISGVCLVLNFTTRPIFASELVYVTPSQVEVLEKAKADNTKWENKIKKKYGTNRVTFVTKGVAHVKLVKYINKKPVKINVVEVNPKLNKNLTIKPKTAGTKLNKRAKISSIASGEKTIVAMNGGYFKPQTGTPLGALMINGEYLTGPIYNRAGIGISKNDYETKFAIGKTGINASISNKHVNLKVDNLNQPRMLSTYVLVYNSKWGSTAPLAPKYGANVVVENGTTVNVTANPVNIPENGYVVSGPKDLVYKLLGQKDLNLEIKPNEIFEDSEHIIAGGPYLIKNGELYIDVNEEKLTAIAGNNPRSAIGYNDEGEFMLITVDGREQSSVGMTLGALARLMKSLGCTNAINLDGGGSSVMYVNGTVKNSPAQKGGIPISNAIVVVEED